MCRATLRQCETLETKTGPYILRTLDIVPCFLPGPDGREVRKGEGGVVVEGHRMGRQGLCFNLQDPSDNIASLLFSIPSYLTSHSAR